jgi:TolA-binding protein
MRQRRFNAAVCLVPLSLVLMSCASTDIGPTIESIQQREVSLAEPALAPIQREDVIINYQQFLDAARGGELYGEALRRLADLRLETGEEKKLSSERLKTEQGRRDMQNAVELYQAYLQTYPGRAGNDLILYQLAKAHTMLGQSRQALQAMDRLVREYPGTRYLDEVQFRRGEILFVLRNYRAAEQAYDQIVRRFPDSLYFEKALYKSGWSRFKQSRYDDALDSYLQLLDRKQQAGQIRTMELADGLSRADQELLNDALRVVSLCFSYQQGAGSVREYFRARGSRPYEPLLYRRLGQLYLDKERITDAAEVYLAYVAQHPESPLAPRFHTDAIDAYKKGNFPSLVLAAKEEFVKRYGVDSRFWQLQDPASRAGIQPLLTRHIRELATHYHAVARKSHKVADFQRAAGWYGTYLRSFPQDKDAARINFLLAETLFDGQQYARAVEQYEKTAYQYPAHARSAEAGYAALLAYTRLDKQLASEDRPRWRQRAIHSALQFSARFPSDKRVPAVLVKTAEELYALKDYPRASQTAQALLQRKDVTDPKLRRTAWIVYGHSQFELAAYTDAERAYQTVLRQMSRKDKQYAALADRLAASIYKQGELARDKGAYARAASHFLRVGAAVPASKLRVTAQYDAATMFIQLGNWNRATGILEDFRKRFPQEKKLQRGVTEKLALAYTRTGQGARAAGEMLALAKVSKDAGFRRDTLLQAAGLYDKAGKRGKAADVYRDYIRQYPRPLPQAMEAMHYLAEYHRKGNRPKQWGHWLNEIVKADARGGSERTARTGYLAATATLELVKPYRTAYQRVKLKIPLKKSLRKKKRLMQTTIKAYERAIKYQVAEVTTQATYQIAEVYHDFARALMKSQRPRGLNAEELEQYDLLLEEQAFPFEEKAIEIHVANIKRASEGIYDRWVRDSLKVLGKLQPVRYAKSEKTEAYVEAIN